MFGGTLSKFGRIKQQRQVADCVVIDSLWTDQLIDFKLGWTALWIQCYHSSYATLERPIVAITNFHHWRQELWTVMILHRCLSVMRN
jgi:hypothetical protein